MKINGIKIEFKGEIQANFHGIISMGCTAFTLAIGKINTTGIQHSR